MTRPTDTRPQAQGKADADLPKPRLVLVTWSTDLADGNDRLLLLAAWLRRRDVDVDVLAVERGHALRRFRRTLPTFVANPWPATETLVRSLGLGAAFTKMKSLRLRLWMAARREAAFLVHHPDAARLLLFLPGGTDRMLVALPDGQWSIDQLDPTSREVLARARAWVVATPEQRRQVQADAPSLPVEILGTVIDPASLPAVTGSRPGVGTVILTGASDPWWADDATIEVLWLLRRAHPTLGLRWLVAGTDAHWLARHDLATAGLTDVEVTSFDDRSGLTDAGIVIRAVDEPTAETHLVAATLAGVPVLDRHGQFGTLALPGPLDIEALIEQVDRWLTDPQGADAEGRSGAARLADRSLDDGGTALLDLTRAVTSSTSAPPTDALARLVGLLLAPRRLGIALSLTVAAAELAALTARVPASQGVPRVAGATLSVVALAIARHVVGARPGLVRRSLPGRTRHGQAPSAHSSPARLVGTFVALLALGPWLVLPLSTGATAVLVVLLLSSLILAWQQPPPEGLGRTRLVADLLATRVLPLAFAMAALGGAGSPTAAWWWATAATCLWAMSAATRATSERPRSEAPWTKEQRHADAESRRARRRTAWHAALEATSVAVLLTVTAFEAWGVAFLFALLLALRATDGGDRAAPTEPGLVPPPPGQGYEVWPILAYAAALVVGDAGWLWIAVPALVLLRRPLHHESADNLRRCRALVPASWRQRAERHVTGLWHGRTGRAARWTGWRLCDAWRVLRDAVIRAWWATYRAHWRVRHATVDPVVNITRRQIRRVRRRLDRSGRSPSDT
ncbi:MAG: hypothetical protein KDB35_23700 [Acidimicrobiales bacterium]|nr:hypothetical protein [Acidimicrobiales bacterium]